jgi:cell wall-associated NlpC family hydrolase
VPYRRNASAPGVGFDCSGLTTYAWSVAGERLARSSGSQIAALARTSLAAVQPGDVLWYPGHVGLALGIGAAYVHSPFPGRPVEISVPRRVSRVGAPDLS